MYRAPEDSRPNNVNTAYARASRASLRAFGIIVDGAVENFTAPALAGDNPMLSYVVAVQNGAGGSATGFILAELIDPSGSAVSHDVVPVGTTREIAQVPAGYDLRITAALSGGTSNAGVYAVIPELDQY